MPLNAYDRSILGFSDFVIVAALNVKVAAPNKKINWGRSALSLAAFATVKDKDLPEIRETPIVER